MPFRARFAITSLYSGQTRAAIVSSFGDDLGRAFAEPARTPSATLDDPARVECARAVPAPAALAGDDTAAASSATSAAARHVHDPAERTPDVHTRTTRTPPARDLCGPHDPSQERRANPHLRRPFVALMLEPLGSYACTRSSMRASAAEVVPSPIWARACIWRMNAVRPESVSRSHVLGRRPTAPLRTST